jgi:membrane protein implicated in regulation of membrane protease activity
VSFRRIALFSLVPAALLGGALLAGLAWVALQAALAVGAVEGALMAWMLAFVVGLPLALPVLALARWRPSRIRERKSRGRDNHFSIPHRGAP